MQADEILAQPPRVLTQEQREFYFQNGYLLVENFVSETWLERLWQVTNDFVEQSRSRSDSDRVFDLEGGHSPENPRLRRLSFPTEQHPLYREFASNGPIVDAAEDLVGPNVKFHHSKLNFKWADGGEEVKWHQDIQFWPHTNYSPLTIGVYMDDVDDEMGPMGVIPGSHNGELFDLYGDDGQWSGAIKDRDLPRAGLDKAVYMKGPRGSITIHNCRTIHGSMPNNSQRSRPLLLHTYASADALHITNLTDRFEFSNVIVRGEPARWIHFDPRPCLIPPDWSKGYTSIFALQQEEEAAGQPTM